MQATATRRTGHERPIVVASDDVHIPLPTSQAPNVPPPAGNEESALRPTQREEAPLPTSTKVHAVPRLHTTDLWLHAIEVTGEQHVERPVTIIVRGVNAVDGRHLRLDRQRHERERSIAIVPRHHRRERTRL